MCFINATTYKFKESNSNKIKGGYCILSHRWTWGNNEIQYHDVLSLGPAVKSKNDFGNFAGACALAKKLGFDLIWIDTCCINKSNHVELSEAINSMYRWYNDSAVCIAYLEDVTSSDPNAFTRSEWFSRGWTLQELIAPKTVKFYGKNWNYLGDKNGLSSAIVTKTRIPADILSKQRHPRSCSVAQRMSWAANRTTTRIEDRAYSLLGLFDVTLSFRYGELDGAFIRLQKRIMKDSSDESIFVWDLDLLEGSKTRDARDVQCGRLAPSPASFARSGNVVVLGRSRGFQITQSGLSISLPAMQRGVGTYQATLNAGRMGVSGKQCAIFLVKLPESNLYARRSTSSGESTFLTEVRLEPRNFTVPLKVRGSLVHLYPGFWLRKVGLQDSHIASHDILRRVEPEFSDRIRLPDQEFEGQPICFMTFPKDGVDNYVSKKISEQAKDMMALPAGSRKAKSLHPLFNDGWTKVTPYELSSLPSNSYDSRLHQAAGQLDHSFDISFRAPLFKVAVSVRRVQDTGYVAAGKAGEIWAVDLVAGMPSV
ncbi:HET-domain-containing protein [Ustulina deusta]|nr:HET-domain-containing protein [Ustulina deusta]